MKNIFKIYKSDLKDILKNKVLLVIVLGLAFLPSLYAWFNIKASWDPYGNTNNLLVAIVNNDEGTTLRDEEINIGDEVVDKLKSNDTLGWEFVDEKKALDGVNKGKYYASVEIPKDFSKDLTSVISDDIKKGEIIYTVNEKINAIAPKITDKGASTIQLEVNQTVVETVTEAMFEVFNSVGIEIETQLPKLSNLESELVEIQGKFKDVQKTISLASDATYKVSNLASDLKKDIPLIQDTITNSKNLVSDLQVFLNDSKESLGKISPIIKNDLQMIKDISSSASSSISGLIDIINSSGEVLPDVLNSLQSKLSTLSNVSDTLLTFLKKLDKFSPSHSLSGVISSLESVSNKLNTSLDIINTIQSQVASGQTPSTDNLNKLLQVVNDVNSISTSLLDNFDSKISGPINNLFEESLKVSNDVVKVLDSAQSKLPEVNDILNTTLDFSGSAKDNIDFAKEKLPMAKSLVDELVDGVKKINSSDDISELVTILKNDALTHASFLKQPVDLKTNRLYELPNYGTGLTPFYTVLSLWVGILLLMSLLSTDVSGDYKSYEVYFGRGLTILSITIVQALIVSIGDILVLDVKPVNPELFVLLSVFTSIVFTSIVYSLVSLFSNVGKAMAIVLLVLQVAASGGTFPIQVTPPFFQAINPILPFTYAISALRETIGGIYEPNLMRSIYMLVVFLIVPILFTVIFKKPINKYSASLKAKFNESDLTGH